ncbi:hypothetical protein FQA39_LY10430 [Lamprigera yunnana]|nr:hypothetical protein FQA39_LY10430 [Lamprigera yunnana]
MNLDSILNCLETLGHFGTVISTEEGIILTNSLLLLKNENHFRNIFFWGRIFGCDKDYYIAFGYVKDALEGRIYYYSTNCMDWGLLPQPTENAKLITPLCSTTFQGDPALVIDVLIDKDEITLGKVLCAPLIRKIKEEDRLSATIYFINEDAAAVPRGGLFKRHDCLVVENVNFEGLSHLDAQEIKCYLHYRVPRLKWNTNLLTRVDYNYALDFLDTLDMDIPEGCWSLQQCVGDSLVILKSLYWPGFVFYHYVETTQYGRPQPLTDDGNKSLASYTALYAAIRPSNTGSRNLTGNSQKFPIQTIEVQRIQEHHHANTRGQHVTSHRMGAEMQRKSAQTATEIVPGSPYLTKK